MLLKCAGEDSWESPGLQDQSSQSQRKSTLNIGRTVAEAEAPILWPPDAKSQLIGKDPDAGKDWGQKEKGEAEDEMIGWCHWLNGLEFEQTLGDSGGLKKHGGLQSMGSQRVRHNLVTEQQQIPHPAMQTSWGKVPSSKKHECVVFDVFGRE